MTIRQFIKKYRVQIDEYLFSEYNFPVEIHRNDKARWRSITHDVGLQLWAKSEGVTNFKWGWLW